MRFALHISLIVGGLSLFFLGGALIANPDDGTEPGRFIRGDTNNDGKQDISDAVFLLNYLFAGGDKPACFAVADINGDGGRDISDAVFMLRFLFMGESSPPAPYPNCDFDAAGAPCSKSMCNN